MNRCPSTLPSWECLKNSAFLQRAACPTTYIFLLNSNLLLPHGRLLVPSLFLLAAADLHPPKWSHSRHPLCKLISCIWQVLTKCCAQAPGSVPGMHGTETKTETVPGPPELTIQYERQVGVHKKPGSPPEALPLPPHLRCGFLLETLSFFTLARSNRLKVVGCWDWHSPERSDPYTVPKAGTCSRVTQSLLTNSVGSDWLGL